MKLVLKNTRLDFKYIKLVQETLQQTIVSTTAASTFTKIGELNVPILAGKTCKITASLSSYVGSPRIILIENWTASNKIIDKYINTEPVVKTYTTVGDVSYVSMQLITAEPAEYTATVTIEYEE